MESILLTNNFQQAMTLATLPSFLLYDLAKWLELRDLSPLIFSSHHFYNLFLKNVEGHSLLKGLITRELGLISNPTQNELELERKEHGCFKDEDHNSFYELIGNCLEVYSDHLKHYRAHIRRMFGFKTSGGIEQMTVKYSVINLFTPNMSSQHYRPTANKNIIATGVLLNEDLVWIE